MLSNGVFCYNGKLCSRVLVSVSRLDPAVRNVKTTQYSEGRCAAGHIMRRGVPLLDEKEWFIKADLSKYIAYIIAFCNQNKSVADLLSSSERINNLLN